MSITFVKFIDVTRLSPSISLISKKTNSFVYRSKIKKAFSVLTFTVITSLIETR